MKIRDDKEKYVWEYLYGDMSSEERLAFEHRLKSDDEVYEIFREQLRYCHKIRWSDAWNKVSEEKAMLKTMHRIRRGRMLGMMRYAAMIVLICTTGVMMWQWLFKGQEAEMTLQAPSSSGTIPVLTLANGEQIFISGHDSLLLKSTTNADIELGSVDGLEYKAKKDVLKKDVSFHELVVPRGCEFNITLSDGSRVWLNAESSLRFPEVFVGEKREVFLKGEGYFEIVKNEQMPFIVRTDEMHLRVLGTSFNVKAYPDDCEIVTTLVTGKISQYYTQIDKSVVLTPSLQSIYTLKDKTLETKKVSVRSALGWREGRVIMNNARLEDIFRELARWYDFKVVYVKPSLKDMRFYVHTNRYAEINRILEQLNATKVLDIKMINDVIYVDY